MAILMPVAIQNLPCMDRMGLMISGPSGTVLKHANYGANFKVMRLTPAAEIAGLNIL